MAVVINTASGIFVLGDLTTGSHERLILDGCVTKGIREVFPASFPERKKIYALPCYVIT